jgi:starvation-inducible DNA-binding protein
MLLTESLNRGTSRLRNRPHEQRRVGSLERDFDGERIALNWAIDELDVEFVVRRWSSASGKRRLVAVETPDPDDGRSRESFKVVGANSEPRGHLSDELPRRARPEHLAGPRRDVSAVGGVIQLLADTMTLRDLYKKCHWQVAGPTFYQLHLLFDKHHGEQNGLVDAIAERIQVLGGLSVAMAPDVAEMTLIPRPPKGREEVPVQISRLLHAHEIVLKESRTMARIAAKNGDDGSNDLIVSDVIRRNELQVWFVAEHVVKVSLTHAR